MIEILPFRSRYEVTVEETEGEVVPPLPSSNDTTHISVVSVDALEEKVDTKKEERVPSPEATSTAPVDQKIPPKKSQMQSEMDHQGHLETSSNISNISNVSGGTVSTVQTESSAEDENRPALSVHIEGTTVEATDVDDDEVFNNSELNAKVFTKVLVFHSL